MGNSVEQMKTTFDLIVAIIFPICICFLGGCSSSEPDCSSITNLELVSIYDAREMIPEEVEGLRLEVGDSISISDWKRYGKLKSLRVYRNVGLLPEVLVGMEELVDLKLIGCGLSQLPDQFKSKCLTGLTLDHNIFESIQVSDTDFPSLKHLSMRHNRLSKIEINNGLFGGLESLDLGENRLKRCGEGATEMENLKYLNLEGNEIENLPGPFSKAKNLEWVSFSGNKSANLFELLCLSNLEVLRLDSLHITNKTNLNNSELPISSNIRFLSLAGSKGVEIDLFSCMEFPFLEYLNLQGAGISEIPEFVFNCTELKTLNLSDNSISKLDPRIFELNSLHSLLLSGNPLIELPSGICDSDVLKYIEVLNCPSEIIDSFHCREKLVLLE